MVELRQNDQKRNPSTVFVFKLVFTLQNREICNLRCFTVFTRKQGARQSSVCYILLRRQPLCKLKAFLLLSTNRDLRLTLDDAGIHYCPRYFWERTRYLGRFLELQRCGIIIYRPRDRGLEFLFLDLGPQNRLQTIHGGSLSAGIYSNIPIYMYFT